MSVFFPKSVALPSYAFRRSPRSPLLCVADRQKKLSPLNPQPTKPYRGCTLSADTLCPKKTEPTTEATDNPYNPPDDYPDAYGEADLYDR